MGLAATISMRAQTRLTPQNLRVDQRWLKDLTYDMTWYALKDTQRVEIGVITTDIQTSKNRLVVVSTIKIKQSPSRWIDSTIANLNNLSPIYHSSYNGQRDMTLKFDRIVKGYYNDKIKKLTSSISDTTSESYFDSNLYPIIVTWLPLQEGYKQDMSIYDFKPGGKCGVLRASVEEVGNGVYESKSSGQREVWVVKVSDEIGPPGGFSIYYIDKTDRRLWKQRIEMGGRIMEMVRGE